MKVKVPATLRSPVPQEALCSESPLAPLGKAGAVSTFCLLYLFFPSKTLGERGWGKRVGG